MQTVDIEPDTSLPQLDRLCDLSFIAPLLMSCIATERSRFSLTSCEVSRIRYRQHTRAIAFYKLNIRDLSDQSQHQLWLTGTVYADRKRTTHIHRKLKKVLLRSTLEVERQLFPLVGYIGDIGMLVQRFPFDRHLPTLHTLVLQPKATLLNNLPCAFENESTQDDAWRIEPMRYRPHLGATLKLSRGDAEASTGKGNGFYLKLFRPGEASKAHRFVHSIYEQNCRQDAFSTVEPIALNEQLNAVMLKEATGTAFDVILRDDHQVADHSERVAEALSAFHRNGTIPLRRRDVGGFLRRAERAVKLLGWANNEIGEQASCVYVSAKSKFTFDRFFATHLDIKPDHIIVGDDRVTLIDMDSSAMSDPVADVAMLLVRLDLMTVIDGVSAAITERAKDAFLTAYLDRSNEICVSTLPSHLAFALLKVALFYMQHQVPRWPERVTLLLDSAMNELTRRR